MYRFICKRCGVVIDRDTKEDLKTARNGHRKKIKGNPFVNQKYCDGLVLTKAGTLSNPQSAKIINSRIA